MVGRGIAETHLRGTNHTRRVHVFLQHTNLEIDAPAGGDVLAVNGDIDGFQLCKASESADATNDLIWHPKEDTSDYVFNTCYPVRVHIIFDESA